MYSISEIIEYGREHGLLGLLKAGVTMFIFHRYQQILLCLSLEDPIPEIQPPPNIAIRKATLADVAELHRCAIGNNWSRSKQQLSKWIAKGYPFFVAVAEDRIIGYACVSLEVPRRHPILGKAISFTDDDAWGADAFVIPTYRGSMIWPAVAIETMKCARALGYRRILSTTPPHNSSSRSAHKKIGYEEITEISSWRILFFGRMNVKSLKDGTPDGQNSQRV